MKQLDEFCAAFQITKKKEIDKAKGLIWFAMRSQDRDAAFFPYVLDLFTAVNLARPNSFRLKKTLKADREVLVRPDRGRDQFSLGRDKLERFDEAYGKIFGPPEKSPVTPFVDGLQEQVAKLGDPYTVAFLLEAIGCLRQGFHRAAVVLSWQGAMAILEHHIYLHKLHDFNKEAAARGFIKRPITQLDQFQRLKESEKLIAAEACGAISKAVKSSLEECLVRRNNCGHPNDFEIGEAQVAAHIESLINHAFSRF